MNIFQFIAKSLLLVVHLLKWILSLFITLLFLASLPAFWRFFVTYPNLEASRIDLQTQRRTVGNKIPLTDFKGVLHAHGFWSHDSRGTLEEILSGAKQAELDFIFFTDHKRVNLDTFPRGYVGKHDGVLVIPGTEHANLLVWPLDSAVVDWNKGRLGVLENVTRSGGLVFYAHSQEPNTWGNPHYNGMEIYNIHTDLKDEFPPRIILNAAINKGRHHRWVYHEFFDEQTEILARWDSLNSSRRIVGIAANDAHNNQSFRARFLDDGRIEWVGSDAKTLTIRRPNWFDRLLLDERNKNGWAFKWELDPYFESFRFVNTHIFADSLDEKNLARHLQKGHVYISFESLGNSEGFQFYAENHRGDLVGIMGDSLGLHEASRLFAHSPLPGKILFLRNGKSVSTTETAVTSENGGGLENRGAFFGLKEAGVYRAEVRVFLNADWISWIYANPIYVF